MTSGPGSLSTAKPGNLLDRVAAGGLLAAGRPVCVLLSGGRDSVCLLDLAVRIAGTGHVAALHCDYGLREASAADAAFCAELCARLGVELHVERPRRPDAAHTDAASPPSTGTDAASPPSTGTDAASPPSTGNLQAWARDQRYAAGARLALARGGDLAAGHTASDQVETVLYRLAASPGRRALLGMHPRAGRLIRPLLGVSRAQTAAHCAARGLAWREDASNASPAFARNRARHALLPALRALHPAAEANVLRTLDLLRDEAEVLDAVVREALATAGDPPRRDALARLPPAVARLALQRLADTAAGGTGPAVGHRTDEVLALPDGGALDLGGGLRAELRAGVLRIGASRGPAAPRPRQAPA